MIYQFVASTGQMMNHGSDLAALAVNNSGGKTENLGPFIAVLPFQNLSSDPEQQYFAEGVSEDITTELSRFTDIQVIARHTAWESYRDNSKHQLLCDRMISAGIPQ